MRRRPTALAGSALLAAACLVTLSAPAQAGGVDQSARAATLWHCEVSGPQGPYYRPCTQVTDASASGLEVLDRSTGDKYRLYNGDSVFLINWSRDSSGLCGVNGNPYVWYVGWVTADGDQHHAFVGDHYLSTGDVATWSSFPTVPNGTHTLGELDQGWGSGTCDVYPS